MVWTIERTQEWISQAVIGGGLFLFVFLTLFLPWATPSLHGRYWFNLGVLMLIGITSGMLGWGFGILLTPIGPQVKGATMLASAFASFWTGVIVSHIETITRTLMGFVHGAPSQATKVRLLFATGIFLMSFIVTWNSRFPKTPESGVDEAKRNAGSPPTGEGGEIPA